VSHTPGPWAVQRLSHARDELWLQVGQASGRGPIARVNSTAEPMPKGCVAELKYLVTPEDEQEANAHLMAAAPELLEALRPFASDLALWQTGFPDDLRVPGLRVTAGHVRRAMAAIAKAEGRTA
jgi:hypothetical protein